FNGDRFTSGTARNGAMVYWSEVHGSRVGPEPYVVGMLRKPENAVVQNNENHLEVHSAGSFELRPDVAEAAVPGDAINGTVGGCHARTQGHQRPPTPTGDAARGEESLPGAFGCQVIDRPERGIAGVRHHDVVFFQQGVQLGHQSLGTDWRI